MKELSIEEKAKLYDKAIEHARSLLKTIGNATLGNLVLKNEFKNMFPALEESEDERIRKTLIKYFRNCVSLEGINGEDISNWLEKQGEQKPAEWHKVGDWVVCNNGPHHIFQVIERSWPNAKYRNINGTEILLNVNTLDKQYHLWTIQDAKDGDVLACENDIVIFKENNYNPEDKSGCMFVYCSCNNFYEIGGINPTDYKPATKEQRDLLFQKMKEAGYEWDADKKELKKVEQTHAWSEEDEINIKELLYLVKTNYLSSVKPHDRLISFLESIKDRVLLQDRINIEVWVTKNKQWILKLNGKVIRGQWGDEPQCIFKQFFYLSEIESLKE